MIHFTSTKLCFGHSWFFCGMVNRKKCVKFHFRRTKEDFRRKLLTWSYLMKKCFMGNFSFCAVWDRIIVGSSHDYKSTRHKKDINLSRNWCQACWITLWSSDKHCTYFLSCHELCTLSLHFYCYITTNQVSIQHLPVKVLPSTSLSRFKISLRSFWKTFCFYVTVKYKYQSKFSHIRIEILA